MKTVWHARVTFLSFSYNTHYPDSYDRAVDKFADTVPFSVKWHEHYRGHTTHFTIKLTSQTSKNKVLRYLRKLHEKDNNLQWCIVKKTEDLYDSDSSSDEYDGVHTLRSESL